MIILVHGEVKTSFLAKFVPHAGYMIIRSMLIRRIRNNALYLNLVVCHVVGQHILDVVR